MIGLLVINMTQMLSVCPSGTDLLLLIGDRFLQGRHWVGRGWLLRGEVGRKVSMPITGHLRRTHHRTSVHLGHYIFI